MPKNGKEESENLYTPAVAGGGHADCMKIGLLLLNEEINKPLRKLKDYLNEMPSILKVFGLDN